MIYRLSFSKRAFKDLEKIDEPSYFAIKQAISQLIENPRPQGCKKLRNRTGYRIRVGDYRVIYEIVDAELHVYVIAVGHRREIYR